MALTQTERYALADSIEMTNLYKALAATQSAVFKRIKQEVDNPGFDAAALNGIVRRLTNDLNNLLPSLLDNSSCGAGFHWDPGLGECVPNAGGNTK